MSRVTVPQCNAYTVIQGNYLDVENRKVHRGSLSVGRHHWLRAPFISKLNKVKAIQYEISDSNAFECNVDCVYPIVYVYSMITINYLIRYQLLNSCPENAR